jgi:peptidoglycan/xylan/chitin deacetylase (PgdA/CDA1 family)
MERLYHAGYTLVNLSDFYDGTAHIPAGRTPAVLTFDDSTRGQFNYLVDDTGGLSIDPDCAVGMILEAAKRWPELGLGGTFFINAFPFGQREYWRQKLAHLVELGFEIGNHTYSHPHLNRLADQAVQEEMVKLHLQVWEAVPGYSIRSLALPFGLSPGNRALAQDGMWNDVSYRHDFVLEVGAEPAFPPLHVRHNPASVPRIAVTDELLTRWLDWLDQPLRRYISDGNPGVITVPEGLRDQIKKAP